MFVVVVHCELHLPAASSLKAKRAVLNRLKDRLRQGSAAVAEVDHADLWQRASLGMAVVSGNATHADELASHLRSIVEREVEVVLLDWTETRY
jgi:uncharacterized protein YlxP (DUF503 family)